MTDTSGGSPAKLLQRVVDCFRHQRVPYVLIGAWALTEWGKPRATNDVDFLVLADGANLDRMSRRMTEMGFALDETWIKWNPMLRGFRLRFQFLNHGYEKPILRQ